VRRIVLWLALAACGAGKPPGTPSAPAPPLRAPVAAGASPCPNIPVSLQPPPALVMPPDFSGTNQTDADCMAWQEFLYLNWAADPAHPGQPDPAASVASYGQPGAVGPTVWESYLTSEEVFTTTGTPTTWNAARPARKLLHQLSKLGDDQLELGAIEQASGGWLTDQSGNLIFYEVHLNQDEYDFITGNSLTTVAGQTACAANPGSGGNGGFNLPAGGGVNGGNLDYTCGGAAAKYGQNLGAIETKAAWRVLPADGSLNDRYKIAAATLHLPDGSTQAATVGLIGLHIIHKVPNAAQLVWATFEQIDNDPDTGNPPSAPALPANAPPITAPTGVAYSLFNPKCDPSTDKVYACAQNTTLSSGQNLPPCPAGTYTPNQCYPYWAPMQVVRSTPVQSLPNTITSYAWSQLPGKSVFGYYRLIDVQWPSQPSQIRPGATVALPQGAIQPASSTRIVANSTMETFVQTQLACMDCHRSAPVAQQAPQRTLRAGVHPVRRLRSTGASGQAAYAADYSFIYASDTQH